MIPVVKGIDVYSNSMVEGISELKTSSGILQYKLKI